MRAAAERQFALVDDVLDMTIEQTRTLLAARDTTEAGPLATPREHLDVRGNQGREHDEETAQSRRGRHCGRRLGPRRRRRQLAHSDRRRLHHRRRQPARLLPPHHPPAPSQNCTKITTVAPGTPAHVVCQTAGQDIYGDNLWDYVVTSVGEGFMSDYYVNTGYAGWIPGIDHC
uniref:hypothetical protein n=1 Tax=Amycolatopsis sp. CA-096443 TaxID=3239919 RepID=UPI003F49646B